MPDPAIEEFFQKRKEDWLGKKTNSSMKEDEIRELEKDGEEKFSTERWLPDAAKRAGQIKIASHPCTFSHPSARKNKNGYATSVIAEAGRLPDGYLRTGNVAVQEDALGNAAALDVYKFLTLIMQDNRTLLEHIENDSELAKTLLNIQSEDYESLKAGFLAMVKNQGAGSITSSKIKQIYFPIGDNEYHLLSVLSNSGLIFELRKRIDDLRFSDKQKELRELKRNNQYSDESFSEIYEITTIGYGGTKPQNVSILNNQYGGKARLLLSAPPRLVKREVQFPSSDFFKNSIRFYDIQAPLQKLHGIFRTGLDGDIPRRNLESGRDHRLEEILDIVIERMAVLRAVASDQYWETSSNLPLYQKIWLCDQYKDERAAQDEWLDELCKHLSQWILAAYKKVIQKPVVLGPAEHLYSTTIINTYREALR